MTRLGDFEKVDSAAANKGSLRYITPLSGLGPATSTPLSTSKGVRHRWHLLIPLTSLWGASRACCTRGEKDNSRQQNREKPDQPKTKCFKNRKPKTVKTRQNEKIDAKMRLCASTRAVAYIEVREELGAARNAFWRYFAFCLKIVHFFS
ncbi:MAG: hypothetical protein A2Y14_02195 [Verrucomicrobia bacterium GWF2_51_19]|nr:MAG: hypothetical protein A2Y14_02195 [Verrucomicrobia bacterium GWF2_51_19]